MRCASTVPSAHTDTVCWRCASSAQCPDTVRTDRLALCALQVRGADERMEAAIRAGNVQDLDDDDEDRVVHELAVGGGGAAEGAGEGA